jgi:uncharacterized protein (TIGR02611 family)
MGRPKRIIRKTLVGLIGFPLLVLGIILIPLPGPGLLVCLAAFFILSLEFEWADKRFQKGKAELKKLYRDAMTKQKSDK